MQVYHCFWSKVTSNQLCHNKWFWKIHCVTFERQSNRDVWRESEMNTDETTLGQTSSYNFQVRAKVHRTISPLSFHSSEEAVPGESRGFRPQFSFFHPKRQSCYHTSSGWKMNTNSSTFLLSSLFWALLYFPVWLPWEIHKISSWSRPLCGPVGKYCMKMFSSKCTFLSLGLKCHRMHQRI